MNNLLTVHDLILGMESLMQPVSYEGNSKNVTIAPGVPHFPDHASILLLKQHFQYETSSV